MKWKISEGRTLRTTAASLTRALYQSAALKVCKTSKAIGGFQVSHSYLVDDAMMNEEDASQDFSCRAHICPLLFPWICVGLTSTDFLTPMIYWPFLESSLGIVGACLPLCRPLADNYLIKSIVQRIKDTFARNDFDPVNQDSQHSSPLGSSTEAVTNNNKTCSDGDAWLRAYQYS